MSVPILLFGKSGQIGGELAAQLRSGEFIGADRQQCDLAKSADIRRAIRDLKPKVIVNAAAYTRVDDAEHEEDLARAINAVAPAIMAEEARNIGALLVHYSTDYVFDGWKNSPYEEADSPNPLGAYGRTKLEGEEAIRSAGVPHVILRTEWIYGTRGKNFLLTILRLATERQELRVVSDQIGAPTWSREIASATAKVLDRLLDRGQQSARLYETCGTFHMTAAGETSWHGFAQAILEECSHRLPRARWLTAATNGRPLVAQRVVAIKTEEYPTPARRPAYSVLSGARLRETFGIELPDWRTQLRSAFESEATAEESDKHLEANAYPSSKQSTKCR
jgi:dTDP-4-dehydrorhamnose reductase